MTAQFQFRTGSQYPSLLPLSTLSVLSPCLTLPLSSLSFLILAVCEESDLSPTQTINVCLPGQRRNCNITAASYALCLQSVRAGEMEVKKNRTKNQEKLTGGFKLHACIITQSLQRLPEAFVLHLIHLNVQRLE